MSAAVELAVWRGAELARHIDALARLRITVFAEYPYLYDGSLEYEQRYLETYSKSAGAAVIGALHEGRVVGAATVLPIEDEPPYVRDALERAGLSLSKVAYLGESVLEREYRGRGLGVRFFELREAHARALGKETATFCGVVRPDDHPARPAGWVALDAFWARRGYGRLDGVTCSFSWRDHGDPSETEKVMQFWSKPLARAAERAP